MVECHHPEFEALIIVNRLVDRDPDRPWAYFPDDCDGDGPCDRYMAEIKIRCKSCKVPFAFKGMEAGMSMSGPMVAPVHADEARMPIEPAPDAPYWGQSEEGGHG